MKKFYILILFSVISVVAVNAQCYSLSYRDFDIEDFITDESEDTTSCKTYMLAYFHAEDTASTIRVIGSNVGRQNAHGQQVTVSVTKRQESMREIQSQRVAFFTIEMGLTPEEAQVFWSLYNQYTEKRNKLVEAQKKMMKGFTAEKVTVMTKVESETAANTFIKLQQQENDLAQEYHKKFMNVLPATKVLLMYKAEKDFMQSLLWHLKGPRR